MFISRGRERLYEEKNTSSKTATDCSHKRRVSESHYSSDPDCVGNVLGSEVELMVAYCPTIVQEMGN